MELVGSVGNTGFATGDGRFVIYTANNPKTGRDIMALPLSGTRAPVTLAATAANETVESLSADGRWLTMTSDAGGQKARAIRRLVTTGDTPVLTSTFSLGVVGVGGAYFGSSIRADGREVFITDDGALKSISLTPDGDGLTLGAPRTLFTMPRGDGSFSVSADGNMLIVTETPFAAGQTLRLLTNWEKRLGK